MTKDELIAFLKENLSISVETSAWSTSVTIILHLGDEKISEDYFFLPNSD